MRVRGSTSFSLRMALLLQYYRRNQTPLSGVYLSIKVSPMSTPDGTKKRRIATDNGGGGSGDNNGIVDDGITMSKILAKLNDMQSELDSCISSRDAMQKEMNTMQKRLSHMDVLEKKCTNLDTRCDSLQRSMQILSKESTWNWSVPSIPLSHWRGFTEDHVDNMQIFLDDIKGYTCALRRGEKVGDSTVYLGSGGDVLQQDDALLPHWKELANALQLHELNHYKLIIHNVQLTSSVLDILAPALKGKQITDFVLKRNEFANNEGIKFITECIKHNNELQVFAWVNNQIDNTKDAMLLVNVIISHPSINSVQIENCLVGDGINSCYEVLRQIFASDRTWGELDLEGNNIQTKGDTAIPNYIASNPPLKNLYLARNKLNDNDAILIARALKGNTNLKQLRLYDNNITHIGKEALSKAVYDPTSLNSMSDCNHTCIVHDEGMNKVPLGCGNDNRKFPSSISKRGAKIYQLLSKRNKEGSNVRHLNLEFDEDDSLKLAPKVLECVHCYPKASKFTVHPLSIMYEIVRGWKMPELYEKRR